jgi:hypothetical protein
MEFAIKVGVYVVAGLFLLLVDVWFAYNVYRTFFSAGLPVVIAPVQIGGIAPGQTGGSGAESQGRNLAYLLQGRISEIGQQFRLAEEALRNTATPPTNPSPGQVQVPHVDQPKPLPGIAVLEKTPAIPLQVQGVQVGGVVSWFYDAVSSGRCIHVTIYRHGDGKTATAAVNLDTPGVDDLYIEGIGPEDDKIITEIAYGIIQRQLLNTGRIPEAGALDRRGLQDLLSTLQKAAELQRRLALGAAPATSEFHDLVGKAEEVIAKTPKWKALIRLAAQLAENAQDTAKAIELFENEKALTDQNQDSNAFAFLTKKIDDLNTRLPKVAVTMQAASMNGGPPPVVPGQRGWPVDALNIPMKPLPPGGKIAILGGLPYPQTLGEIDKEILPPDLNTEPDPVMQEHLTALVQTVRLVTPNAHFIFAPMRTKGGGFPESELLQALLRVGATKPDVVLITLGPLQGDIWEDVLTRVATTTVVVLVAGNNAGQPIPFQGKPLLKELLVAAAVDENGDRAGFSQVGEGVVYAPGVHIPVVLPPDRRQFKQGTSYSAALTAGVAAWVRAAKPDLSVNKVVEALQTTASPPQPNKERVLNLRAALQKVGAPAD